MHRAESGRSQEWSLQLSSPNGLMDGATLLTKTCDNMHGELPTREACLSLGVEFLLELRHADFNITGLTTCAELIPHGPKPPS